MKKARVIFREEPGDFLDTYFLRGDEIAWKAYEDAGLFQITDGIRTAIVPLRTFCAAIIIDLGNEK